MDFFDVVSNNDISSNENISLDLDRIKPRFDEYRRMALTTYNEAEALVVQDNEALQMAVALGGKIKKIIKTVETKRKEYIEIPSNFVKGVNAICKQITDPLTDAETILKRKINQYQAKLELERREYEAKAKAEAEALQKKLVIETQELNKKRLEEAISEARMKWQVELEIKLQEAHKKGLTERQIINLRHKEEERLSHIIEEIKNRFEHIEIPTVITPITKAVPKVIHTEEGAASQRTIWTFDIIDESLVPREYMTINTGKIRDAIKMGVREIPGIKIYQTTQTILRT